MVERRVGCAVVSNDSGRITGLITDRDLSSQVLAFGYPTNAPISEFMTTDIVKVDETSTVDEVVHKMEEFGIRRLPIVRQTESHREKCVGIVTLDELIAACAVDIKTLSRIVSQQILRHVPKVDHQDDDRHAARREQTLNRFYILVAERTGLDRSRSEDVAFYLLSAIVQRLPPSGAAQLISQLPKLLQEDLLDLKAGPNREITPDALLAGMVERFGMTFGESGAVLEHFWEALDAFTLHSHEVDQALMQFPQEIRRLLVKTAS